VSRHVAVAVVYIPLWDDTQYEQTCMCPYGRMFQKTEFQADVVWVPVEHINVTC
jgi:hypothetical protein